MSDTTNFTGWPEPIGTINGEALAPQYGIQHGPDPYFPGVYMAWITESGGGPGLEKRVHQLDADDEVWIGRYRVPITYP